MHARGMGSEISRELDRQSWIWMASTPVAHCTEAGRPSSIRRAGLRQTAGCSLSRDSK
jgi:hypothetical protein